MNQNAAALLHIMLMQTYLFTEQVEPAVLLVFSPSQY
jgi:hypothetical protein